MNNRVFLKVFFEKSRYLILYSLSIVTFWYVLLFDVADAMYSDYYEKKMPDIEITGEPSGLDNTFLQYHDLNAPLKTGLTEAGVEGVKVYGLTVRNLYTFSDAYYQVAYRIYGADDEFLGELSQYLKRGRLPEAGKTEALIGSNAAKFFNVTAGDVLDLPITLEEQDGSASRRYIVSGIIKENAGFFSDGIYISKNTFENLEHAVDDNTLYVYTKTDKAYGKVLNLLERFETGKDAGGSGGIGEISRYYENKTSLSRTVLTALLKSIPFSAAVLTVLFISLMKYVGRKIGLMKALGVSDRYLTRLLGKGLSVYNLIGLSISFVSLGLMSLTMGIPLSAPVVLYSIFSFAITFAVTAVILFFLCKQISPRLAMYQY